MKKKMRVVIGKSFPRVLAWRDLIKTKPQGLIYDVLACCLQYAAVFHEYPMMGCVSLEHMKEVVRDDVRYEATINADDETDIGKKICMLHELGSSSKLLPILENCIKVAEPGEEEWVCDRDYVMQLSVDAVMGEHISGNPSITPHTYSKGKSYTEELSNEESRTAKEELVEVTPKAKVFETDSYTDEEYMDYIMSSAVTLEQLQELKRHELSEKHKERAERVDMAISMFGLVSF